MTSSPSRIALLGLGGTIAMTSDNGDDRRGPGRGGVALALSAAELVEAVPGLAQLELDLSTEDVRRLPSASLTFEDLDELAETVRKRFAAGVNGVVVTQGTDTIEESAYLLDLVHRGPEPLVVTGALRNPTLAGADGAANLLAAVQVAASPTACDRGCLVVVADEIHAARRVRKTHTTSLTTFASPNGGPLGYVVEGAVRFVNDLPGRLTLPDGEPSAPLPAPRVGLVVLALGDDDALLHGAADRLDGLVVAGFGGGHVPASMVDPLVELAAQVPVVLASRTGEGSVLASTYGFAGSESDLLPAGLISAGFLDPFKARVLLRTLLARGSNQATTSAAFAAAGEYASADTWPWPLRPA